MTFRPSAPQFQEVSPRPALGRVMETSGETPVDTPKLELVQPSEPLLHTATTISGIKEWVGSNKERAQTALDDELTSDHPRSTLLMWLEGLLQDKE